MIRTDPCGKDYINILGIAKQATEDRGDLRVGLK
jgi:hypothetical protein